MMTAVLPCQSASSAAADRGPRTLPARYYTDPRIFELEKERIFFQAWQYAAHLSQFPRTGSFVTLGLLDQNLLFVRGEDGEVRGFYNVCRHRAHELASGSGCMDAIVCPYHAWRYALDGTLRYARHADTVAGFETGDFSLVEVRVERFLDFIMFSLDPAADSFASQVPGLADEIRSRVPRLSELTPEPDITGFANSTLACNWKVLVDNCVECYHCSSAHPAFVDLVDIESYRVTLHARYTAHVAECRLPRNRAYGYEAGDDGGGFAFWHVWPNITFGRFPGTANLGVFCADPVTPVSTRSRGERLCLPATALSIAEAAEVRARRRYIDEVLWPEDKRICESVQRGLACRVYDRGPLMVAGALEGQSEAVCHHFQTLTRAALGEIVAG